MGLFDRFFKKDLNSTIFSFIFGSAAPDMKGIDFLKAYKGWVYTCVSAIAEEVSTIDLHLQRLTSDGWQEVKNHIALTTLRQVNSFMSSSDLMIATQAFLELDGNAFWYVSKGSITGKPSEIWVLDPTRMYVVKSSTTFISGFVYRNEKGHDVPLAVDEIIHFKRFNPLNRYRGMGTVQAAALAIDIDTYSAQWNKNFFFNAAIPSAVLETEGSLTEEQYSRIKAKWDVSHTGLENAHKLAILQGGLKYKSMQMTQKEMDFLEQRKFSRDEILSIFRVPKTILGITEDVNRANAEASEYVFAKRVIKPKMEFIADRLNEFYLPFFGEDPNKLRFVFSDPVPQNVELDLKRKETALRAGYLTINEVREEEGKPPVDNGDAIYISSLQVPLGTTNNTNAKTIKKVHDEKTQERITKRRQFIINEIKRRIPLFTALFEKARDQIVGKLESLSKKSVSKARIDDIVRVAFEDFGELSLLFANEIKDTLSTSLQRAGSQALPRVGVGVVFDIDNPRVMEYLRQHAAESVTSISNSIRGEVRSRIIDGVDEGLGPDAIARNIREFFNGQANFRAARIARTEVVAGFQQGNLEGYIQSGNVAEKRWLTAGDELVDQDCQKNEEDGDIALSASFSSGDSAPPVHPNCRCDLVPVVSDTEKTLLYQGIYEKAEKNLDLKIKTNKEQLEKDRIITKAEIEKLIEEAKQKSQVIIAEAKKQGEEEKMHLIENLRKLKGKVLQTLYEKKT